MRSLINIDVVANHVCARINDHSLKYKWFIMDLLIDCYVDFMQYSNYSLSLKTEVLDWGHSIELPKDFISVTKVGLMRKGCGHVAIVHVKDTPFQEMGHTEFRSYLDQIWDGAITPATQLYFYNPFYRGNTMGELYGYGRTSGRTQSVVLDRANGVIHLGSEIPEHTKVVVEYQSDGLKDGLKLIPREAKNIFTYYALKEWYLSEFQSNMSKAAAFESKYDGEFNLVTAAANYTDPTYLVDCINSSMSPTNY